MTSFDCNGLPIDSLDGSDQLEAAANYFTTNGYVILDNVLPRSDVEELNQEFVRDYPSFLAGRPSDESRDVGTGRTLMALRFSGGFGDPKVFANPVVVALVRKLLEPTAILEAYGCILSRPGAVEQHVHQDGPHLFGTLLSAMLPPYALTFGLPLVEMNERQGTTALWPGSHRWHERKPGIPPLVPVVRPGSCMMWDYRLRHYGTENRSDVARPMVYCTYSRPWYQDPVNFRDRPRMRRLDFAAGFPDTLPGDIRKLFATVA